MGCLLLGVGIGVAAAGAELVSLTGGSGTVVFDGRLYAREGGTISTTVRTSADTRCVVVFVNGVEVARQSSYPGTTTWPFSLRAPAGDGTRSVRATGYLLPSCEHADGSATASYVLDNTGPAVRAKVTPEPNGAGWNTSDVTLVWSAVDNGFSGVVIVPSPRRALLESETAGTTLRATATDRLGNVGEGFAVIKIDKTAPKISATRAPAANARGWNKGPVTVRFTCSDALSGIGSCTSARTIRAEGTTALVRGTAVDVAGNTASAAVGPITIDTTPPSVILKGVVPGSIYPTGVEPAPSCEARDALSGPDRCVGNVTVPAGDRYARTYVAHAFDRAGNRAVRTVRYRIAAPGETSFRLRATLRPLVRTSRLARVSGLAVGTVRMRPDGTSRLAWRLVLRGVRRGSTLAKIRVRTGPRPLVLTLCRRCGVRAHGGARVGPKLTRQLLASRARVEVRERRRGRLVLAGKLVVRRLRSSGGQ